MIMFHALISWSVSVLIYFSFFPIQIAYTFTWGAKWRLCFLRNLAELRIKHEKYLSIGCENVCSLVFYLSCFPKSTGRYFFFLNKHFDQFHTKKKRRDETRRDEKRREEKRREEKRREEKRRKEKKRKEKKREEKRREEHWTVEQLNS